jgi:signal peptidase II
VGIVVYARRAQSTAAIWLFGIGLGGALGNLIDRLFRAPGFGRGHVVDFINYGNQFVGNVADIAIVGAAIAVALLAAFGVKVLLPAHPGAPEDEQPVSLATGATVADGDVSRDGSAAAPRE